MHCLLFIYCLLFLLHAAHRGRLDRRASPIRASGLLRQGRKKKSTCLSRAAPDPSFPVLDSPSLSRASLRRRSSLRCSTHRRASDPSFPCFPTASFADSTHLRPLLVVAVAGGSKKTWQDLQLFRVHGLTVDCIPVVFLVSDSGSNLRLGCAGVLIGRRLAKESRRLPTNINTHSRFLISWDKEERTLGGSAVDTQILAQFPAKKKDT